MRGGIAWPMRYEYLGVVQSHGYVVMAGQDVKTNKVYVFEQLQWVTIDNILDNDNQLRYIGLSHWLNETWSTYFGNTFFWQQGDELARRFRLQVLRSPMINPKPKFIEVPTSMSNITGDVISVIWNALTAKSLRRAREENPLNNQLNAVQSGSKTTFPAVHALGVCLLGLERFPWRPPHEKPVKEYLVPFR